MPLKIVPPRAGKSPFWYVRGTLLGIRLDRSTQAVAEKDAKAVLKRWRDEIYRGQYGGAPAAADTRPTFLKAANAYMKAGGENKFLAAILDHKGPEAIAEMLLVDVDQMSIDRIAAAIYPHATAQTRNRQCYTPIAAVLHRAGIERKVRRPKGWMGKKSTSWLEPDQAFALFAEADRLDPEFGLLCRWLLYTGMRINEALGLTLGALQLDRAYCYLPDSKTGQPRGCHLPPVLVQALIDQAPRRDEPVVRDAHGCYVSGGVPVEDAGVPFLQRKVGARLFRYHKGGRLYDMLKVAMAAAGLAFPRRQGGFHLFCHSYGSWMHRWGELDTHGLTRTGRWADADSADRYVHTEASEEARRADLLPTKARTG